MPLPENKNTVSPSTAKPALAAVPSAKAASGPQMLKIKRGHMLFSEGDNSRAMYFLKSGMIRIFKKKGTASIELDTIHSGQVLGELAFLDGNPRSASGEALTDCELMEISGPTFQSVFNNMPDWLKILLKTVVNRLRTASTRIRQLESASTSVDYTSGKDGRGKQIYTYLTPGEQLKVLTGVLLLASRYGKPNPEIKGIELRMGLLSRFTNQIMNVPVAKATTMTDILTQTGVLALIEDPSNPAIPKTVLTDINFLDQLIQYLSDENLLEDSKRHDISPRSFAIMTWVAQHLTKYPRDPATGIATVNIGEIIQLEKTPEGKAAFRLDEFDALVARGYATDLNLKSATEAYTQINVATFLLHLRLQRVCMAIQTVNEDKRKG